MALFNVPSWLAAGLSPVSETSLGALVAFAAALAGAMVSAWRSPWRRAMAAVDPDMQAFIATQHRRPGR